MSLINRWVRGEKMSIGDLDLNDLDHDGVAFRNIFMIRLFEIKIGYKLEIIALDRNDPLPSLAMTGKEGENFSKLFFDADDNGKTGWFNMIVPFDVSDCIPYYRWEKDVHEILFVLKTDLR